jgi:hypothetical protein
MMEKSPLVFGRWSLAISILSAQALPGGEPLAGHQTV